MFWPAWILRLLGYQTRPKLHEHWLYQHAVHEVTSVTSTHVTMQCGLMTTTTTIKNLLQEGQRVRM